MKEETKLAKFLGYGISSVFVAIFSLGVGMLFMSAFFSGELNFPFVSAAGTSTNLSSTVTVGNAAPTVNTVTLNGGSVINLTAGTTTNITVGAQLGDSNGCADFMTNGTTTMMLYRSGITSSTCSTTQSNVNCYKLPIATSTCTGAGTSTTITATTTFAVYYFADGTDVSSTASSQNWLATVWIRDASNATGSKDSAGVELNTMTALDITTSSIDYGTLGAGASSSVSSVATTTNAGNSSSTLYLSAIQTLGSGGNWMATGSQHYATSSTAYGTNDFALQDTDTLVSGFVMTGPTSTSAVAKATFWRLLVPGGSPSGTYSGTTKFLAGWTQ